MNFLCATSGAFPSSRFRPPTLLHFQLFVFLHCYCSSKHEKGDEGRWQKFTDIFFVMFLARLLCVMEMASLPMKGCTGRS